MKYFKVNVIDEKIKTAATVADKLFHPESKMMAEIRNKDDFLFDSGYGIEIYLRILAFNNQIPIFIYQSINPLTSSIGYYDGDAIYVNTRKLPGLTPSALVGLLCHELCHAIGFSHGSNFKTKFKVERSVPYFISENISKWI